MNVINRLFNTLPKRLFTLAIFALAMLLPLSSLSAAAVLIEGSLGVANVTAGDTKYSRSVNAKYDEVVKVQVFYHNRESQNSGKVAQNLSVKLNIPNKPGTKQVVSGVIHGDNTNRVTDQVTVNLNRADAHLEYIPGSATWKHNKGTNEKPNIVTEKISDAVVTAGQGLRLENAKPCHNFSAYVTVLVRVRVPSVSITKKVREKGVGQAVEQMQAKAGTRLEYLLTAKNIGNKTLTNVTLRDALPSELTFVPGTVKLYNGPNPNGVVINNDHLFKGGVNGGSIGPGAWIYITFEADVKSKKDLKCGVNNIKNIAVVKTGQTGEYNNTATVTVKKVCEEKPELKKPVCDLLELKKLGGRKVEATVKYTANDAEPRSATFDFGDGSNPTVTNRSEQENTFKAEHTYAKDGEYTVSARVHFRLDGKDIVVDGEQCTAKVKFETPEEPEKPEKPKKPEQLPVTGAGSIAGIFAATSAAGAIAHRIVLGRRVK